MYAIIESGGKQYRVEPGTVIRVEKLAAEPGSSVELPVLAVAVKEGQFLAGPSAAPYRVKAKVLGTVKTDKIIVFKYKRRKQYKRKQGHRQQLTELRIESIESPQA